jgi:hypothetical protein
MRKPGHSPFLWVGLVYRCVRGGEFIWFVSFPNQMNQTNEIDQRDQMDQIPATRREILDCKT